MKRVHANRDVSDTVSTVHTTHFPRQNPLPIRYCTLFQSSLLYILNLQIILVLKTHVCTIPTNTWPLGLRWQMSLCGLLVTVSAQQVNEHRCHPVRPLSALVTPHECVVCFRSNGFRQ